MWLFILLKVSIAKIKKESGQCIIFYLNIYLRNNANITNVLCNYRKFYISIVRLVIYFTLTLNIDKFSIKFFIIDVK